MFEIKKLLAKSLKPQPRGSDLGFGRYFSDHMFSIKYEGGEWKDPKISPYAPLELDPGSAVLHYGQALFEGMKAFKQDSGKIVLFRPDYNWKRMKNGAERICMPMVDENVFWSSIRQLIQVDQSWVPQEPSCSLYIRPTLIATEAFLGVRPSNNYLFFVILSPVGSYYGGSVESGVNIWVEDEFVRAAPGGLGATKTGANYANSLFAAHRARQKGFSQVLWLDVNHEYIEEVGTMNVFFVFENEIVTPKLDGTILAGGVRDSVITLLEEWKMPIKQRKISLSEVKERATKGELKEVFGAGTAAVITAVNELSIRGLESISLPQKGFGPLSKRLYDELQNIQYGRVPDRHGWIYGLE